MVDAALIQQCAHPGLEPAIVRRFIDRVGAPDPLAVTVRSGNRIVLVPRPATPDEALALIRQHVGRNVVRVGITQYPAGLGMLDTGELKAGLVEACENIRMGTALFAKVYRIVTRWYGAPAEEAFEDATIAWQTGYFEGENVFRAPDPGEIKLAAPETGNTPMEEVPLAVEEEQNSGQPGTEVADPNRAGIRIDLSRLGEKM